LTPEDIIALRDFAQQRRGNLNGYNIAAGGNPRRPDWDDECDYIRSLAAVGITRWTEYIPPQAGNLETVQGFIKRSPLRID
jgi:hypothetical protein